jgi:ABC-type uncharacterized transport system substrate-binding protein
MRILRFQEMKMKHLFKSAMAAFVMICFLFPNVYATDRGNFPVTPKMNSGKKWRIGYLEGGSNEGYPENLRALITAFSEIGWTKKVNFPVPVDTSDTKNLWVWISRNVKSEYLEFLPDAYWSNNWDEHLRLKNRKLILERLNRNKDIDFMLAMGTWAGQDLANNEHSVPTTVMFATNPILSNISKSINDSGYDHLHVHIDPTLYEKQIRIFHDIFHFKNLGVVLEENTAEGRSYAAIDDIEKVAKELEFNIVKCNAPFSGVTPEEARDAFIKCHEELSRRADAVYITAHRGITLPYIPRFMVQFLANKIPTFSQRGTEEVKHGVLLSTSAAGSNYVGRFHAETIAKIFNGAKPRDLGQIFEDPPRIAINLKTASIIGYDPAVDVLGFADEVFEDIAEIK